MAVRSCRHFWSQPWGYSHAFTVTAGLLLTGILLQYATGDVEVRMPARPWNLVALGAFVAVLVLARVLAGASPLFRSLSGVPFSVASLSLVSLLSLVAGMVPQDGSSWPHRIIPSWPFGLAVFLLLANLGLAILRRGFTLTLRGTGWFLNHLGLWALAATMVFGAGDIAQVRVFAYEGKTATTALLADDEQELHPIQLPFALGMRLEGFRMEEYPPRLVFANPISGKRVKVFDLKDGLKGSVAGTSFEVAKFIPSAEKTGEGYAPAPGGKGSCAALVRATVNGRKVEGWVSPTGGNYGPRVLEIAGGILVTAESAPRLYRSDVTLLMKDGKERKGVIQVNHPLTVAGWKLYQSSYDVERGKASTMSVIDAVRDPWLPAAYAGILMLFAGAASLFVTGVRTRGSK